jgi:ABC-type nitrate/sulfonate/bicarbonate transport system substrate-binding protein
MSRFNPGATVKGARGAWGFLGIVIFAAEVALLAQKPAVQTLRVVGGGMPIRVARMNGILAKYGIDVQTTAMNSSEVMRADLADGKEDIAESGLDNGIAMVANGVADVVLVDGSAYADQELVAQPGIKSAADLRGKTLIVDATNTQNALMLKKILLLSGLKQMADYKFVSGYVNRFEEMQKHKEYAAGMLGSTQARVAERQGFVSLGTSAKLIGPLLNGGAFVRRQWASEHADLLVRYIAATIEAQRWIMSPANKAKVMEMMAGTGAAKLPGELVAAAYEQQMKGPGAPGALSKDLQFDVEAFKNFLKLRAEVEGSWGGKAPAAEKFYDLSYYRKALTMVKN